MSAAGARDRAVSSGASGPFTVALLAGALTGAIDALVTIATNPDPGLVAERFGLLVVPVLLAVAWAAPLGLALAGAWGGRRWAPTAAAVLVATLWGGGVLLDARRAGQAPAALAVLCLATVLGGLAVVRVALDGGRLLARLRPGARRLVWGASGLVLLGGLAVALPGASNLRAGTGPCPAAGAAVSTTPNVLLVTVDTLRLDAARTMRSYRRLAAAGIEHGQHVTTSPWTLPSLASLLTGLPPSQNGAGVSLSSRSLLARSPVADDVQTVAGVLGAHGYRTHAIVTNPFLSARYGIDRGFCSLENVTMESEAARGLAQTTLLRWARVLVPGALPSDRADVVRARAERWLRAEGARPFFLWLHFLDPHAPYGDRPGDSTSLTLDLMAFQGGSGVTRPFHGVGLLRAGEYRPGPAEQRRIADLYREDVAFADQEIGRLLDFLESSGLAARTAVVFTADHGEEFWEHGGVEHGRTLYEEVLRVPLVVVPAGAPAPGTRDELTSVLDVAPTILALAGLGAPEWPGTSLIGAAGPVPERSLPLGHMLFGEEWSGLRGPRLKYMRSAHGEERLFDLERDPEERVNLVGAMPAAVTRLRAATAPPDAVAGDGRPTPRSAAFDALGYVQ